MRGLSDQLGSLLILALVAATGAAAATPVPEEFQGRWVPSQATCESPVAVLVAADRLTLINGNDSESLGDIELARLDYLGPDYRGITRVLITESSGQQPALVSFNFGEKPGVALIEFSPVMPGKPTPQSNEYNARIRKLNLGKRFPLDKAPLKKCQIPASPKGMPPAP